MFLFVAALFAKPSAISYPITPAFALTQHNVIFHSLSFISVTFLLISSIMCVYILLFCSLSNVVWLSVYIVTVLSVVWNFSMFSRSVNIANCSAWLFVHFFFSPHCIVLMLSPDLYTATPEPTPLSDLLPSVNICIGFFSSSSFKTLIIVNAGCCYFLTLVSLSKCVLSFVFPLVA